MQSAILDVAIGVVFSWFLLSLVLSAVNEGIAYLTRARAKHLWLAVGRLANPSRLPIPNRLLDIGVALPMSGRLDVRPLTSGGTGSSWWASVTGWLTGRRRRQTDTPQGRVRSDNEALYRQLEGQITELAKPGRLSKVTQVPARAYATAVTELARQMVVKADLVAAATQLEWDEARCGWLSGAVADWAEDEHVTADIVRELRRGHTTGAPSEDELTELYGTAQTIVTPRDLMRLYESNPALRNAIRQAATALDLPSAVDRAKAAVEHEFEQAMDQLSRFYRRQSRKILFVLAIPLVLATHANTIAIFDELRNDQTARDAAVMAASGVTASDDNGDLCAVVQPSTTTAPATDTPATTDLLTQADQQLECAQAALERAREFRWGLAWQEFKDSDGNTGADADAEWADVKPYLVDDWGIAGRLITLVALMFGAQFWLDALRRLVGFRKGDMGVTGAGAAG